MTASRLFDVYLARFPFVDKSKTKLRPVIITSRQHGKNHIIIVIPVSSKDDSAAIDFVIQDMDSAGLTRKSIARVHRLTALAEADLCERLGSLSKTDSESLKRSLRELLGLS